MSGRRPGPSSGGGGGGGKLRMDRQPAVARISDPSLPMGRRKEIDSVMKKARANNSGDWDKKLLDIEEKDPNRWRHTGFKKMYIEGDSSPDAATGAVDHHYRESRDMPPRRNAPVLASPPRNRERERERDRLPVPRRRSPRSPSREMRRRSPHSEMPMRRGRSPPPMVMDKRIGSGSVRGPTKRPPSPRSKSTDSSYSADDAPRLYPSHHQPHHQPSGSHHYHHHPQQQQLHPQPAPSSSSMHHRHGGHYRSRSRSVSIPRARPPPSSSSARTAHAMASSSSAGGGRGHGSSMAGASSSSGAAVIGKTRHIPLENLDELEDDLKRHGKRTKKVHVPEDPRLAARQRPPATSTSAGHSNGGPSNGESSSAHAAKKRTKGHEKLRARVKIEGEKRKKRQSSSEDSDNSSSSESEAEEAIPNFAATTRMTLSERFGKMAAWSVDRSNMDNLKTMRITKDSAGGPLKVMIEEQAAAAAAAVAVHQEPPPPRREYSPVAPVGHFPEELALTAPSGLMSWDDVRVRYDYYKNRGYLRDLDLQDYVKWEEWWYKYQEWLKQERYYEFWERQQMRRRRKKVPIAQRLN